MMYLFVPYRDKCDLAHNKRYNTVYITPNEYGVIENWCYDNDRKDYAICMRDSIL